GLIVGHVRKDKADYFQRLEKLIQELGLQEIVYIATDLTNMPAVYAASDCVVSCSKKPESFGLTLVEALAMNTPVIATRHGGPLDIIEEGKNGTFFEPCYADELASLLVRPVEKGEFREATLQYFSLQQMSAGNLSVYNEVCQR
ncbi:MAG: glycosyltransferase, partial [Kiritimatiellaceae bacterium]|nr:glycosyltransferase [Kiritimatiellaceae bacterium]